MQQSEQLAAAVAGVAAAFVIWVATERGRKKTAWHAMEGWISKRPIFKFVNPEKLMLITDFDATITSGDSQQCHDLFGESKLMS